MFPTTGTTEAPAIGLTLPPHRRPGTARRFSTACGVAHACHPEAAAERRTAALLLEAGSA
ncbi:hypothetical protein [Streptomyces sp. NPDC051162]|uniref:hypothetical protein n=1 Tax=unclassified Streptomyces TaxID=2593676 RepID=UPI0034391E7E